MVRALPRVTAARAQAHSTLPAPMIPIFIIQPRLRNTIDRGVDQTAEAIKADTEFKLRIAFGIADSRQAALLQLKELLWWLFAAYRVMPAISNPGESRSASANGAAVELAQESSEAAGPVPLLIFV